MRKKTILALVVAVLMLVTAVYAQSTRARTGIGRVKPEQMTKGARMVPMKIYIGSDQGAATVRKWAPPADTVAGAKKWYLWQPPINGYVANFYLTAGTTMALLDSIPDADSAVDKAYRFRILKNNKLPAGILGERKTRVVPNATAAGQLAAVPSPGKKWFITGTDTTSKFNLLSTDTLFFYADTCGGVPDSLPRNMWIEFEWYPADKQ